MNYSKKATFTLAIITAISFNACQHTPPQMGGQEDKSSTKASIPSDAHTADTHSLQEMPTDFLWLAAQDAIAHQKIDLAIYFLTALTQKTADHPPQLALSELLIQTRHPADAIAHLDKILADQTIASDTSTPEQLNAYLMKSRALFMQENFIQGLQLLSDINTFHPEMLSARLLHARILINQKRYNEALEVINQGISHEDHFALRNLQSDLYLQINRSDKAIESLQAMQALVPEDETAIIKQAGIYIHQQQQRLAEKLLVAAIPAYQANTGMRELLASIYVERGNIDEGIAIYQSLLQESGEDVSYLGTLGIIYFSQQNYQQAANYFDRAYAENPDEKNTFYLAASLEALEKNSEAIALFKQITKTPTPMHQEIMLRLARLEMIEKSYLDAEQHLQMLIQEQPSKLAYSLLSNLYLITQDYQKLLDETDIAAESENWVTTTLLFNRSVAYESLKQYRYLEDSLKALLEMDANHPEALNFLGYSYVEQGIKLDEAKALIERALAITPDNGYYIDSLAWLYFKQGHYQEALATQTQAIAILTDDPVMFEHLGDIYWMLNDHPHAIEAWNNALNAKHSDPAMIQNKIAHGLTTH
ncbi:MAG: tetratricopeptide repeat protein [Zetaproteobacteria bacterium]|nr:tetratricopeptide repeat protein [Zetaproteobacteria bacterium]